VVKFDQNVMVVHDLPLIYWNRLEKAETILKASAVMISLQRWERLGMDKYELQP
jgi:hypothetical protein